MNIHAFLIVLILGLGLIPTSPQTKKAFDPGKSKIGSDYMPTKLKIISHVFRGNSTSMIWEGNVLQFEKTVAGNATRKEIITPSQQSWKKFWQEMDAIEIWKWDSEYIDKSLADGRSWEVLLEYGDKRIHSTGRNMYPAQFERYEKAVLELQGEKAK